ncbi:hypothetical protein [Nocardioides sp. Root190]|uniref:hypothetical protein n=1 Tax=Nocardioides sp. Root190 TaxID=1736488 RepID=UPI0012FA98DB|nr:hypothetical protein [Nocardioides sp. Root190]
MAGDQDQVADPEQQYAQLVAGEPSRIREIAADIGAQDPAVITALDHVSDGIGATRWTGGLASAPAALAGRMIYVDGTLVSWRLHRASSVLDALAGDLVDLEDWALRGIQFWRRRDPALDAAQVETLRASVSLYLAVYAAYASVRLQSAATELTTFDAEIVEWLRNGAGKDYDVGVKYGGHRGPRIPDTVANGDGNGWTPQGLAHDGDGHFVTTSYRTDAGELGNPDDDVDDSQLSVIDDRTGEVVSQVQLNGWGGAVPPQHSGGVAINGDRVFVVGGGKLYEYSMAEIREAGPGGAVTPVRTPDDIGGATSYVTVANGNLYLGNYGGSEVTSHPLDGDGRPDLDGGTTYTTPDGTNGIAVLPDGSHVYSVNAGRGAPGELVVDNHPSPGGLDADHTIEIGNLPEELVLVDGQLVVANEAGADDYAPWDEDGRDGAGDDGVKDTGGSENTAAEDFWAQTHLHSIPLEALDGPGADGFYVDPISLEDGARELWRCSDALDVARTALLGLHLPASLLPEVSGADALSTALDTRLDEDRGDLVDLAAAGDRIGNSLKDTADDYTVTDLLTGRTIDAQARALVDG